MQVAYILSGWHDCAGLPSVCFIILVELLRRYMRSCKNDDVPGVYCGCGLCEGRCGAGAAVYIPYAVHNISILTVSYVSDMES